MPSLITASTPVSSFSAAHIHDISPQTITAPGVTVQMSMVVTIGINVGRPVVESLVVGPATAVIQRKFVRSVSESIEIQENISRFKRSNNAVIDSLTVIDGALRAIVQSRIVSEVVDVIAVVSKSGMFTKTAAESFTILSAALSQRISFKVRAVSESLAIAEDGIVEFCHEVGVFKEIIRHQLGRFFSVLPQRNLRAYTFMTNLIREKEKQQ